MMLACDAKRCIQSKTTAEICFGCESRVEDAACYLTRYSWPIVRHHYPRAGCGLPALNGDSASWRTSVYCVHNEICERLPEEYGTSECRQL